MTTLKTKADIGGGGLVHWLLQDTMDGLRRRRALLGYIFLLPTLLGSFIFTAGPVFVSFALSLYRWNIFKPPDYIEIGQLRAPDQRCQSRHQLCQYTQIYRSSCRQPSIDWPDFGVGCASDYQYRNALLFPHGVFLAASDVRRFSCRLHGIYLS